MEQCLELASFYRGVTSWPASEAELAGAAAKIQKTCGFPLVAIASYPSNTSAVATDFRGEEKVAIACDETAGKVDGAAQGALREFLKKNIALEGESNAGELRTLSLTRELGVAFGAFPEVRNLVIVPVCGEVWAGPSIREGRVRRDFGWVLVGTSRALEASQELLLVSVAQRLSELAEITQLEAVISLRGQFLSIASHELKTPLTSIYGILQLQERMLRLKKEDSEAIQLERQHSFLKMVIRQVERLNELIDGLLDVSRIQNGRFMVEPSETDVAAVVREAISARLSVIAEEAGVKLHLDSPETVMAWVDPVRFEEVVTNLVMNAIRFSPEGGAVWIRLKDDAESFQLFVRDQGPSVSMEDRERIFQPFERAQRTARLGGLGLGLFISRQIAQLHGGNVSLIESVPGKGNVFTAYFPVREGSRASA